MTVNGVGRMMPHKRHIAEQVQTVIDRPAVLRALVGELEPALAETLPCDEEKVEQTRQAIVAVETPQAVRVVLEDDGVIGIDFDWGPRDVISFSLSADFLGFSALLGETGLSGRKVFETPLPQAFIDRIAASLRHDELSSDPRQIEPPPGDHELLREALRKLANEAAGFLSMADVSTHGRTNVAVLQLRIDEARAALSEHLVAAETPAET